MHKNIIIDHEPQLHPELTQCTFAPRVNALSSVIDRQQQTKLLAGKIVRNGAKPSRVDAMLLKEQEKAKRIEAKRKDQAIKEIENCSFKPLLVANKIETAKPLRPSSTRAKPQQKPSWVLKEERDFSNCTFQPKINNYCTST